MRTLIFIFLVSQFLTSQEINKTIEIHPSNWEAFDGTKALFETFDNRKTLLLNGKVFVKDTEFSNGTIEVDIYAKNTRSFAGIVFRRKTGSMEEVYLRMHKSNQIDAIQYTPTFNKDLSWQLYNEYQAKVKFKEQGWNKLRIEVVEDKSTIYVNDTEVLKVDQLKTNHMKGEIGLFALFENRFSNFKYTQQNIIDDDISNDSRLITDSTIISKWNLSQPFPYTNKEIAVTDFFDQDYETVETEKSGLLPISKFIKKSSSGNFDNNEEAFAIAMKTIESDIEQRKVFSFDFSDKIIVYLNNQPVFYGNNAFRSKGNQFMGHMNIDANKVYLNLKKGQNFLHCVVIERANGWGLIGKLIDF